MTRFIFLTDTHIGAAPIGFHQQPAYPDQIEQLMQHIQKVVASGDIDFILHGGDMVHHCTVDHIKEAARLFDLPIPVYLSLGNHDLDREGALELWLQHAPQLFIDGSPQYTINCDDCAIQVVPNQWEPGVAYCWKSSQDAYFFENQLQQLDIALAYSSHKPQLLSIHNPIYGVPMEQSGKDHVIHPVTAHFQQSVLDIFSRHNQLKGVLSGHNHIHTLKHSDQGVFLTSGSFVETPFEYKVIELTSCTLSIETKACSGPFTFEPAYHAELSYVLGRDIDRAIHWNFNC